MELIIYRTLIFAFLFVSFMTLFIATYQFAKEDDLEYTQHRRKKKKRKRRSI